MPPGQHKYISKLSQNHAVSSGGLVPFPAVASGGTSTHEVLCRAQTCSVHKPPDGYLSLNCLCILLNQIADQLQFWQVLTAARSDLLSQLDLTNNKQQFYIREQIDNRTNFRTFPFHPILQDVTNLNRLPAQVGIWLVKQRFAVICPYSF